MLTLILVTLAGKGIAAPPVLDALHPPGIRIGTTVQITAEGKAEPWPANIHCSNPDITFKPDPKKKGSFSVTAAKKAKPGPCLVRVHTRDGASKPMIFIVGTLPETTETLDKKGNENNDSNTTAQKIHALPVTINGRLIKTDDVDIYRLTLKKGQTLIATLEGYGLRAPMDPYLHLYDPDGALIILGNDNGINLDPMLVHKVTRNGDYTVAVMAYSHPPGSDIRFTGKKNTVYRLTLTTGPWLSYAIPLTVKTTGITPLKLFGYNLPDHKPHIPLDFTNPDANAENVIIRHPSFPNQLILPLTSSHPSVLSKDTEIKIPAAATGQLSQPAETDRIIFTAKKGQKFDIRVSSRSFGFPLDPVLVIQNAKGKQLKRVDDGNVKTDRDAKIVWSAPEDGKFTLLISDLFHKGGPLWFYLLTVSEAKQGFSATTDKSTYTVEGGKTVDVKIKITRLNGHKAPLKIEVGKLPPGVTIIPPKEIPDKNADITVKIKADDTAPAANLGIHFTLKETTGGTPVSQLANFSFLPKIPGGPYLLNDTTNIWLTVKTKPKPKPKPPAKPEPDKKKDVAKD
ncbi:MAG: hypothetical protein IID32_03165 [Planctomycetes bacterium]|nr:hypothetical protein [Planctomycetota bacterium]